MWSKNIPEVKEELSATLTACATKGGSCEDRSTVTVAAKAAENRMAFRGACQENVKQRVNRIDDDLANVVRGFVSCWGCSILFVFQLCIYMHLRVYTCIYVRYVHITWIYVTYVHTNEDDAI